jgi:hypothetical protein
MRKKTGIYFVAVFSTAFGVGSPAHAARLCKDGYVTYTGSAPAISRSIAEANAVRAWRRAGTEPFKERTPLTNVRCVQDRGSGMWRCFVRAGRCASV